MWKDGPCGPSSATSQGVTSSESVKRSWPEEVWPVRVLVPAGNPSPAAAQHPEILQVPLIYKPQSAPSTRATAAAAAGSRNPRCSRLPRAGWASGGRFSGAVGVGLGSWVGGSPVGRKLLAAFFSFQSDQRLARRTDPQRAGSCSRPAPGSQPGFHGSGQPPSPPIGPQTQDPEPRPQPPPPPPPRDKSRHRHFRRRGQRACAGRPASESRWQRRRAANSREWRAAWVRPGQWRRRGLRSGPRASREVEPTPRRGGRPAPSPFPSLTLSSPGSRSGSSERRGRPGQSPRLRSRPRGRARPPAPRPAPSPPTRRLCGSRAAAAELGAGGGPGSALWRAACEARGPQRARTLGGRPPLADAGNSPSRAPRAPQRRRDHEEVLSNAQVRGRRRRRRSGGWRGRRGRGRLWLRWLVRGGPGVRRRPLPGHPGGVASRRYGGEARAGR